MVSGWSSARWYSSEPSRSQTPGLAGRAEDLVVGVPGRAADPPPGHAPDQLLGRDVDQDGGRDPRAAPGERLVERRGLDRRAREAVEDDARGRVGPAEPLQEEPDRDLVGDELPRVHVATRLHAQGCPVAHGGPEEVPGGDHRDPEPFREQRGLGALPGARGAEQDDHVHLIKPSYWRMSSWASSCFIVSTTTETTIRMPVPPSAMSVEIRLDHADEGGQGRDDAQEEGAGDGDPGDHPGEVVLRGTPRPDAGNEAAVLPQLLGGLVRLERERRVEVREADGQQEVQDHVEPRALSEQAHDAPRDGPDGIRRVREVVRDLHREQQDGDGEDDRDDAGLVHPQGEERLAARVHPSASHAGRVLDGDAALPLLDVDDHRRRRAPPGWRTAGCERGPGC